MIFEQKYQILVEDFDKNANMTLGAILRIFENVGNGHSELAKDGIFATREQAWVLSEWNIEIIKLPKYSDNIVAQTWSHDLSSPLWATRDYVLKINDEICVKGVSKWIWFDLNQNKICKINTDILDRYKPEPTKLFGDQKFEKIAVDDEILGETRIFVRKSDFDFNGHVHNLEYLNYALEVLPNMPNEFKKLRISYKSPITKNEEIVAKFSGKNGIFVVQICDKSGQIKALVKFE